MTRKVRSAECHGVIVKLRLLEKTFAPVCKPEFHTDLTAKCKDRKLAGRGAGREPVGRAELPPGRAPPPELRDPPGPGPGLCCTHLCRGATNPSPSFLTLSISRRACSSGMKCPPPATQLAPGALGGPRGGKRPAERGPERRVPSTEELTRGASAQELLAQCLSSGLLLEKEESRR